MKVAVWDTYVNRKDGQGVMHFDILVDSELTDEAKVLEFGKTYLKSKSFKNLELTSKECEFCHVENASDTMKVEIESKGYFIIEIKNCN